MIDISKYKIIFFDCDGVILDSNTIKSQAYYDIAYEKYDYTVANALVRYQTDNPHLGRFKLFFNFFAEIDTFELNVSIKDINKMVELYGEICVENLLKAEETEGLRDFLSFIKIPKFVVTGSLEDDVRCVLKKKGLSSYFDGIHGSPRNKIRIISDLSLDFKIAGPCLLIGDSDYDYETAIKYGFDFIFMSQYTSFRSYKSFFANKNIDIINNLLDLL